jgi:hypothetical protein
MKMDIKEAVRVIGENIPGPYNKMVDRNHIKLVLAWYKFLEEFERLERENAELLKGDKAE